MGFYTNRNKLDINGNAFGFNGNDTNPDGSAGNKDDLPGIAADTSAYDHLLDNLNSTQIKNIKESGYEEKELDNQDLQEHLDMYSDVTEPFDASSGTPLGTEDDPKVVMLEGEEVAKDEKQPQYLRWA